MNDFLLELRSEEIPARMQKGARAELEKLFRREMDAAGVSLGELTIWSTPRRLALIARDLPNATEAVSEEAKGPPEGAPDQAVDGFCRKNGVSRDELELREVKGRNTYFAVKNIPGRETADVLAEAIPAIVRDFAWPKSMRWGDASITTESTRWVRPLSGIVALLDGEVVPCEVDGITSGRETVGHRFHGIRKSDPKSRNFGIPIEFFKDKNPTVLNDNGMIEIGSADDYASKLADAHVIVNHEAREDEIRIGAIAAAKRAGLTLIKDEGLVVENAGLTEWPVPLLGRFEEDFLDVPPETIQLTARVNQKYFVCEDADGNLANAFICTANIDAEDPAVVVDGNRKVLAARLSDARFFWDLDQKKTLAEHAKGLERITFHEKLGTVADKVERVAKLARWLCEEGIVKGDADLAEQAAKLCKADLVTEMVGEFPDLQGLMGGYYAAKEGLPVEVSDAIRDHYKPVGQGDDVPTAPVTVAVSLADKLDTLFGFFQIGELPTGSKDPFALRRAAISAINLIESNGLRVLVSEIARFWNTGETVGPGLQVEDFLHDRLGVMMRDGGVRYDVVQASAELGTRLDGDVWRVRRRAKALQAFVESEDGTNLLAGYKRAANILKKEEWETGAANPSPEPAEAALIAALDTAEPKAATAIEAEDFAAAMSALSILRTPIDAFFEDVIVNAEENHVRAARLDLLARFRDAVHTVADFSKIEG